MSVQVSIDLPEDVFSATRSTPDLGAGETEVISHCHSNPQNVAIIDDRATKKHFSCLAP